ncbi:MAG TPA: 2-hydroxyacyl-CoA dehydratase [Dehalococcoidales bacterium]|nr:MAG: 2-hydroxyglutaryl-CoA dehydratase [Chloroflexi bacterium RBG_16_60_22]HJX12228.1 2-hydroxyacyl-CoA dehydratase [Dehalococcoidales bacterium]
MKKIGITTTVPVEVLMAAGYQPVDLNNVLVTDPNPGRLIAIAERAGFPLNCCSWIKGIYGVCLDYGIEHILCVTGGDCSNTVMLMEVLRLKGLNAIPFAYPDRPDPSLMRTALEGLAAALGTTLEAAEGVREQLHEGRDLALKLDELTWRRNTVSGKENHLWLVTASDFNQDYRKYCRELRDRLEAPPTRPPYPAGELRLAYIGVPAVYAGELYDFIEKHGARVVFNEVQRQFAMPEPGADLASQYANYTYPYSIQDRLKDIKAELPRRNIDGVIHYVQAFCHRGIGDIVFREAVGRPVLTLEGNDDFFLNTHVKTRVEAFLDMLERSRQLLKQKTSLRRL